MTEHSPAALRFVELMYLSRYGLGNKNDSFDVSNKDVICGDSKAVGERISNEAGENGRRARGRMECMDGGDGVKKQTTEREKGSKLTIGCSPDITLEIVPLIREDTHWILGWKTERNVLALDERASAGSR